MYKLYITNTPSLVQYVSFPSYIQITQGAEGYAGVIGGGIQQNMGGFTTLCSANAGVYTEIFRVCWNGFSLTTDLNMGPKTLTCGATTCSCLNTSGTVTCGTLSCSSLSMDALSTPTNTGSTTVN